VSVHRYRQNAGPRRNSDGIGGGDKGQGRDQDLIVPLNADQYQGHMKSRRAVDDGNDLPGAREVGEHAFEPIDIGSDI
jgi:hypothetical protein